MEAEAASQKDKIQCMIDGGMTHSISGYLKQYHPDVSLDEYKRRFPDAPIYSPFALQRYKELEEEKTREKAVEVAAKEIADEFEVGHFHEIFDLGAAPAAMSSSGKPIQIRVRTVDKSDPESGLLIPDVKRNYVFDIPLVKSAVTAMMMNKTGYFWGYHGTGKTSLIVQVAARLRWPLLRVQHTVNTEESHILGQYVVMEGETRWQHGPLALAMLNGWVYLADEYDCATPGVVSVYQPVLEGEPLYIKEAPPEMRLIRPHKHFRFLATGNTNGSGDETGLYSGTQIQNAANYSRFAITEEVKYMDKKIEAQILCSTAQIKPADSNKLVEFATHVRNLFAENKIGLPPSPREMINAAELAVMRGSDWKAGLCQAYVNRLGRHDKEAVTQYMQRQFG